MKKVRVRIAVAVAPDGGYVSTGSDSQDDETKRDEAIEFSSADYDASEFRVSFVEADVPMPEPQPETTIEGKVSQ